MSDWRSENERKTRGERFSEIMKSDLASFRGEVKSAFSAEKGRVFLLADIALEILMRPVGRTLLAVAALFLLWILL